MRSSRSSSECGSSTGSISPPLSSTSNSTKSYRMASNFELGCEQPRTYKQRAENLAASSYQNLFGPVPPGRCRPLSKKVLPPVRRDARSRKPKPLPVNPLTGDIIGLPSHLPQASGQHHDTRKVSAGVLHNLLW